MNADDFNALYPVGTPVLAFPETRAERPYITRTSSRAWDVQHGLAVVHVAGLRGAVSLVAVDPLPDDYEGGAA